MVTSVVADDVAFGPENLGVPQPQIAVRVEEALAAVDMLDYAQADPADLSGGQRQRTRSRARLPCIPAYSCSMNGRPCWMLRADAPFSASHATLMSRASPSCTSRTLWTMPWLQGASLSWTGAHRPRGYAGRGVCPARCHLFAWT